ncbi:MAG: DUF721 domain-containing protein [Planctomycetota bacterium]|jgi:hypothetical protein|nr:DUF721 domain-containing protein [Planctomycetota bacterium]
MKRLALPTAARRVIQEERDREWREWFSSVYYARLGLERREIRHSFPDSGDKKPIFRPAADPIPLAKLLKREKAPGGLLYACDLDMIRKLWTEVAGDETAGRTRIRSFKDGILTLDVDNAPLLQEIRQFRQIGLGAAMRGKWPLSLPLLRIIYRVGKTTSRKGRPSPTKGTAGNPGEDSARRPKV